MAKESDWVKGTKQPFSGHNQPTQPVNPVGKKGPRSKTTVGKSTGRA